MNSAYIYVLMAAALWTIATQFYSIIGRQISISRFNLYKSVLAFILFFLVTSIAKDSFPSCRIAGILTISGISGFAIADLFIFWGFAQMGAARTMMMASFTPLMIAIYSYFILDKTLPSSKLIGIVFLILCLLFLALEKGKKRNYSTLVPIMVFIGINFDALGVTLSKHSFMRDPELTSAMANSIRTLPAIIILLIINYFKKIPIRINTLSLKLKWQIVISILLGTFLALLIYLHAISLDGHPAVIAALGSISPFIAMIYENIRDKQIPSKYQLLAASSVICGLLFII